MEPTIFGRTLLVASIVTCLSVGTAQAINFNFDFGGQFSCNAGPFSAFGQGEISVSLDDCSASFDGATCAYVTDDGCCSSGSCTIDIDKITVFSDPPTGAPNCVGSGASFVLCDDAVIGNECTDNAADWNVLLGQSDWLALYGSASVLLETDSGVQWGGVNAVNDKEPPGCPQVPTLSQWGLIAMGALLALGAIAILRRRLQPTQ